MILRVIFTDISLVIELPISNQIAVLTKLCIVFDKKMCHAGAIRNELVCHWRPTICSSYENSIKFIYFDTLS